MPTPHLEKRQHRGQRCPHCLDGDEREEETEGGEEGGGPAGQVSLLAPAPQAGGPGEPEAILLLTVQYWVWLLGRDKKLIYAKNVSKFFLCIRWYTIYRGKSYGTQLFSQRSYQS